MEQPYRTQIEDILSMSKQETTKARKEAIKLLWRKASEYSVALTDYSATFKRIKDEFYKKSISETNHEAGEQTGYRHKKIEVQIEAIKALVEYLSDVSVQLSPTQAHPTQSQPGPSTSEEQASQTGQE